MAAKKTKKVAKKVVKKKEPTRGRTAWILNAAQEARNLGLQLRGLRDGGMIESETTTPHQWSWDDTMLCYISPTYSKWQKHRGIVPMKAPLELAKKFMIHQLLEAYQDEYFLEQTSGGFFGVKIVELSLGDRSELVRYLERRGTMVREEESTHTLRVAALKDLGDEIGIDLDLNLLYHRK